MRKRKGLFALGAGLMILSAVIYAAHYYFFGRDRRFIEDWFFGSLAFLPISILFVTIIFQNIIGARDRELLIDKLNMVIGSFFSETGTGFMDYMKNSVNIPDEIRPSLLVTAKWRKKDYEAAAEKLRGAEFGIDSRKVGLDGLKKYLTSRREFLLRLLENQNLLEHQAFTDLMWAVFHVIDELEHRQSMSGLPETDYAHLSGDIQRAYALLIVQWLGYMRHLQEQYPYLFSLAVRTNPFDPAASVEIR